ncbi:MAG: large conductance mechanosensitive channel protein MscL [Cardiobacteriaceae bacterium]|nr:large conductance mechanosensitive channel protein MscL [Cardiobacteriaceae bacterium]
MLSGFKNFIARGNVVDLAVGVVMGAAFGLVVTGLVESFINPLIAWLVGKPNFDSLVFTLPAIVGDAPTTFQYGKIITAIVNFFLVSLAIYIFIIIPMNKLTARMKKEETAAPAEPSEEILLLREIRDNLARLNTAQTKNTDK